MPHRRYPMSRREMLAACAGGFGAVALHAMLADAQPQTPGTHRPTRVRNVIFLYMDGGVSQVDSFDYKPLLEKHHGEDPHKAIGKLEKTQFANIGKVMKSPWKFSRRGESGLWVSDLFPHMAAE